MKKILMVDDEKSFLFSAQKGLESYAEQFCVMIAINGSEAIKVLNSNKIDLVITDIRMPVMNGFDLIAYMSRECSRVPIIVLTAFGTPKIQDQLKQMGTFHYLEKPLDIDLLLEVMQKALENRC